MVSNIEPIDDRDFPESFLDGVSEMDSEVG